MFQYRALLYINYFFRMAELKLKQHNSKNVNEQAANNRYTPENKMFYCYILNEKSLGWMHLFSYHNLFSSILEIPSVLYIDIMHV